MSLDIKEILKELSKTRPLFQNETDLQFFIALALKEKGYEIRLEYYSGKENNKRKYVDLVAVKNNECYIFEFKYKTKKEEITISNERFELFDHQSKGLGSYLVLKDLERTEKHMNQKFLNLKVTKGYVIFLTNDKSYKKGLRNNHLCYNYALTDNKIFIKNEPLEFNIPSNKTKAETSVKDFEEVKFKNTYQIKWETYSKYLDMLIFEIK